MRKSIIAVFCIFWVFLIIGCSGSSETEGQNVGDFEENTIQSVGSATISGTGKIIIKGDFKAGDGVLIKPSTSRALTRGEDGDDTGADSESDTKYYQTGSGYYLVMVEKDGEIEIEPEKMNLSKGETVSIGKFNNKNDFAITFKEHTQNNVRNITEEYYYVDFSSDEFEGLNKSDIIVRQTRRGGGGKVCIITRKNGTQADVRCSADYSNETGIGILQATSFNTGSNEAPARIHVVSPINLSVGDTDKKLTDLFSIIRIKASLFESGKEYCLKVTGVDANTIKALAENSYFQKTLLKNERGSDYGLAIPYFSVENGTITYYIGLLTEDRLFDINFESFYTGLDSVNFGISIIEKPENIPGIDSLTDVTAEGSTEVTLKAPYESNSIITVPYKASQKTKVILTSALDNKEYNCYGYFYHRSDNESGHGELSLAHSDADMRDNTFAYFVISLKDRGLKKGDEIVTFTKKATELYQDGYVYTFKEGTLGKYVSSSGGITIDGAEMLAGDEGKEFISGSFVCNSAAEELAGLCMKNGFYYCNGEPFGHNIINCNGTGNRAVQHGYKNDDPTVTYFFEVDEFRYMSASDKSITGTMVLLEDNKETDSFENVSFVWKDSTGN